MNEPQYVTIVCSVCHARLDERPEAAPRTIKCPDCFTELHVPAVTETKPPQPRPAPEPPAETYALQQTDRNERQIGARQQQLDSGLALVVCGVCGARLYPRPKQEARLVRCPDCREPVRVPSIAEAADRQKRDEYRSRKPDPVEPLPVPEPAPRREISTAHWEARSAIKREEESDPPRWTFFSGVFSFPWHAEVWSRWLFLSGGLSVLGFMIGLIVLLALGVAGYSGIVLAFFILPAIWIAVWTMSYAASCWLVVVEDTASGNQVIHNWQQGNWREWIMSAMYVGYVLSLACAAGYGVGRLVELGGESRWLGILPTVWLLFPVLILSSLEAGAWWVPVTRPILRSMVEHPGGWLLYYVLSTLVGGIGAAVGLAFINHLPIYGLLALGPLWGTVLLIHARLLGRLGSLISLDETPPDDTKEAQPET